MALYVVADHNGFRFNRNQGLSISYAIGQGNPPAGRGFTLSYDEYHMFWTQELGFYNNTQQKEYDAKDIADIIWNEWLETVGIM